MSYEWLFLMWVQLHRTAFLDRFMVAFTALGSEYVLPVIAVVGLVGAWKGAKNGVEVLCAGGVMLACLGVVELLKHWIDRARPELPVALAWETSPSFPSAHAAMSMCVFPVLALIAGKGWFWPAAALAVLIGLTRLYVGVHFPSDVIVGWIVGAIFVCIYSRLVREVA